MKIYKVPSNIRNASKNELIIMVMELLDKTDEFEVYKKAFELLSMAYCDKGDCLEKCECFELCRSLGDSGVKITKELFLQKARKNETN